MKKLMLLFVWKEIILMISLGSKPLRDPIS